MERWVIRWLQYPDVIFLATIVLLGPPMLDGLDPFVGRASAEWIAAAFAGWLYWLFSSSSFISERRLELAAAEPPPASGPSSRAR